MTNPLVKENSASRGVTSNNAALKTADTQSLRVNPKYEALLLRNGLDSLDALFAIPNDQTLGKPGLATWRERIRLTLDDGEKGVVAYLKRYNRPPRSVRPVRYSDTCLARSHAGIEWAWAQRFKQCGVFCVEPMAVGEVFEGRKEQRSAILLAKVPGRSLENWATEWAQANRPVDHQLLKDIAMLVATMHESGFVHRDLYLSHIFFDPTTKNEPRLHLIDLQRVFRPSVFRLRWIVKDLAALHYSTPESIISRADRLRWLRWYIERSKLGVGAKALAYRIIGKAQRMTAHDKHRLARVRCVIV